MNFTITDGDPSNDPLNSILSPSFTYTMDKYSCVVGFFYIHVTFNWLIFFSGIFCFLSRIVPGTQWTHIWFGRLYIVFMIWSTVSSLLIHNTGLPTGVLVSFVWVISGLTLGWFAINVHQYKMQQAAYKNVSEALQDRRGNEGPIDLGTLVAKEKGRIAAKKTWQERLFSLKALHGCLMFMSWTNIAGRIFATKSYDGFSCHTYPYYKQIDTKDFQGAGQPLTPVEVHDPRFSRTPWGKTGLPGWATMLSLGPLALSFAVGACFSTAADPRRKRRGTTEHGSPEQSRQELSTTSRLVELR